jgi:peptidoglycan/xylan/chitin deacetylase (PgdA/CDA1 family)/GT2 family glycosyltransferase
MSSSTRFSIVIPTYQRRDLAVRAVAALKRQVFKNFEVVVVVDGSTDGTAEALRRLRTAFRLTVLEQANSGAAAARNRGASAATAEIVLFLDDDMEADDQLLAEHDRSHTEGADMVLGHLPLHPASPSTLLSRGVGRWSERRRERLSRPDAVVPVADLLTGQMSISRATFQRLGGFDVAFTRGGLFGGEDIDFGYRVVEAGLRIVFNDAARSYQLWSVDPGVFLRRMREAGRSAEELRAKHPQLAGTGDPASRFRAQGSRLVFGTLAAAPRRLSWPLRALVAERVRRGADDRLTEWLFLEVRTMEYRRGARAARRALRAQKAAVLAYHAIADLRDDRVLAAYGVPPERLAEHVDGLARQGYRFITLDHVIEAVDGRVLLPDRALLLTFDDAYVDLLTAAAPILAQRGIPAVVFAVAGKMGGTNEWDRALGAQPLRLLDAKGLRDVEAQGIVVGSHGMSHRRLVELPQDEVDEELRRSAEELASAGVTRPLAFSYPYGLWNHDVTAATRAAGYVVAFTITPGVVRRGDNRFLLPRIEVSACDSAKTLRLKIATAGWPDRWRRKALRLLQADT